MTCFGLGMYFPCHVCVVHFACIVACVQGVCFEHPNGFSLLFCTLQNLPQQMHTQNIWHTVKVDLCTNFGGNLVNTHRIITNYSH